MSEPNEIPPVDRAPTAAASPLAASLANVQTVVLLVGAIVAACVPIAYNICKLPFVSSHCPATEDRSKRKPEPPARSDARAEIRKRIEALGIQRDTKLENVNLKVYHQRSIDNPVVEDVVAGLQAAGFNVGFNVNEAQVDLGNVVGVDRTPGMVWVKSTGGRKEMRPVARDAILKALKAAPYDRVKVSDIDLPDTNADATKRAGEVQVDVF
jgi:hypothetical protein